ncbi:MAG: hypothetical protein LUG24_04790 [Clostridiales bacterium]|nr:hypothetical protein [Clostridiales bacterium]
MGKKKGAEREKQIQEWYEMYKAYQKSGKSVSEWCTEKRITERSFYHKIRVLRKAGLDVGARGKTAAERTDDYSNTDYGEAVEKQEIVSINDMSSEGYCNGRYIKIISGNISAELPEDISNQERAYREYFTC